MATNSTVVDDSSVPPPSYDTIFSAIPIQFGQSSIFPFHCMKEKRKAVLSRIRNIVLGPDFTPSYVAPNVNACTAVLPAHELSKILTERNIEGHTALYWAISCDCMDNLYDACMITNNHAIFMHLSLESMLVKEGGCLRRALGCPPDEIRVHTCNECTNQFNVVLKIRMFQKRLRMATYKELWFEFVAEGRIWWLKFYAPSPVTSDSGICRKPGAHAAPPEALKILLLSTNTIFPVTVPSRITNELGDWVMHDKTEYVDDEGTLNAKLEVTLL
ncbi:uncharacterized protein EDB93DRAFT_1103179 [Suillus bovinus]|uniref:uncharacterized protein n=1 Tax=Suillus bovinus TaxID=48563 RepID=UPI001B860006|nr:uncharacterized protein EDB93DRAFT_1103179 [Suillus bovinus]KAG2151222.1 hypothetical protein EDB93DRAFT_1103179 [Suillus bovinus]